MAALKIKINPLLGEGTPEEPGLNLPTIDYREIIALQGNLKDLTKTNYDRLRKSLKEDGLLSPFYLWRNPDDKKFYAVDGHQRKRVLTAENVQPYEMPYILIPATSFAEAKRKLLQISAQYGSVTQEGFDEFKVTLDVPAEWIQETINFDALFREFNPNFGQGDKLEGGGKANNADGSEPLASDDDYSNYEIVILHENKTKLLYVLNAIKDENKLEKQEDALMHLVDSYKFNTPQNAENKQPVISGV